MPYTRPSRAHLGLEHEYLLKPRPVPSANSTQPSVRFLNLGSEVGCPILAFCARVGFLTFLNCGLKTPPGYGLSCLGITLVPSRVNSNRSVQLLSTPRPAIFAGLNFHCCAACNAARAKYLLGPGDSRSAPSTFPDRSTSTLTLTFTVPRIVFLALSRTSGKTCWATSP